MPKKSALLFSLLPLALVLQRPVFADAAPTDAPADQQAPAPKPGLMSRFAHLFDAFDTSKPENQHVFVIGGSSPQPAGTASPPPGETAAAAAPTAASAGAPESPPADTPASTAKPHAHGFTLSSGFQAADGSNSAPAAAHPPQ